MPNSTTWIRTVAAGLSRASRDMILKCATTTEGWIAEAKWNKEIYLLITI